MNQISCLYPDRDAVIVAYLYDDIEPSGRAAFETHVATCVPCRGELAELRQVRTRLGEWAPPEPARTSFANFDSRSSRESRIPNPDSRWYSIPVWAQVAAAMLVLGVSAAVANLDVHYDHNGLTVRTGWSKVAAVAQAAPADPAPWRAELTALQSQLRSEMRARPASVSATSVVPASGAISDVELRRRVRVMLDESEKRQQTELALRLAQLQSDVYAQRQADLSKINQNIGFIQNTYGNTYGDLRNYVLKVSQKQ